MTKAVDMANLGSDTDQFAYTHPTGAGYEHLPAGAAAGQTLLRNTGNTAYEWADAATGVDQIINPTFSSPDSTFTTSGTYSKPASVADDDYMWVFIVNGGGGGGADPSGSMYVNGGLGGYPLLLYGKASNFHNSTYVLGAGGQGNTSNNEWSYNGGVSSITLHASQGGTTYNPSNANFVYYVGGGSVTLGGTTLVGGFTGGNKFSLPSVHTGWATQNTGATYVNGGGLGGYTSVPNHAVFGGGGGGGCHDSYGIDITLYGESFLSGNGGAGTRTGTGSAGATHGGGGAAGRTGGGAGANGTMRVYYV